MMYVGIVKRGIRGKLFFRLVKFTSLRLIFYYYYIHNTTACSIK